MCSEILHLQIPAISTKTMASSRQLNGGENRAYQGPMRQICIAPRRSSRSWPDSSHQLRVRLPVLDPLPPCFCEKSVRKCRFCPIPTVSFLLLWVVAERAPPIPQPLLRVGVCVAVELPKGGSCGFVQSLGVMRSGHSPSDLRSFPHAESHAPSTLSGYKSILNRCRCWRLDLLYGSVCSVVCGAAEWIWARKLTALQEYLHVGTIRFIFGRSWSSRCPQH